MTGAKSFRILFIALALLLSLGPTANSSTAAPTADPSFSGPVVQISALDSNEYVPDIAYNSVHNEYLVVWENAWAGGYHDVYARRVAADGRILSWFAVASNPNKQVNPAVAYDPINDRYLVVFAYDYWGDDSDWDINGRFIPWNGSDPSLLDFGICTWESDQRHPDVAYAYAQQEFMVTWTSQADMVPAYISARRVSASGGFPTDDGFTISSGAEPRDFSSIAYNLARNEYLVTWDVDMGSDDLNISGMRLNATGSALLGGSPPAIGEFTIAGWSSYEEQPAVAACHTADQFLVAWQSDQDTGKTDFAIYARYINGEAVPGNVYMISDTTLPQRNADVSCDAQGKRYLLAWQDQYATGLLYGIWGRKAYPNESLGDEFEVMGPRSLADRQYPAVAGGKTSFLTAWEHDRDGGGNIDIYGRLLGYFTYLPFARR